MNRNPANAERPPAVTFEDAFEMVRRILDQPLLWIEPPPVKYYDHFVKVDKMVRREPVTHKAEYG
jgi:hypothetical protein